ncbi:hypothetical protein L596_019773 [Steinernema carpocapsae]|uniref:Uncharacterized protein n=1 Tax=Steinernema carpocapsae TaxID=34508 RepID=A0A4U5MS22_STECR|nr:hypothetical protein L596_019773 [Steinernema carpocapsae]
MAAILSVLLFVSLAFTNSDWKESQALVLRRIIPTLERILDPIGREFHTNSENVLLSKVLYRVIQDKSKFRILELTHIGRFTELFLALQVQNNEELRSIQLYGKTWTTDIIVR